MRFEGVLSSWSHEAGRGTIRPLGGGDEVPVGLAAFPTDGEGPRTDEVLSFEIVTGRDGRKQAVNLRRMSRVPSGPMIREAVGAGAARVRARQAQRKRRLGLMAGGAVVMLMLVVGGMHWWQPGTPAEVPPAMRR